jgi:hypothetical protein
MADGWDGDEQLIIDVALGLREVQKYLSMNHETQFKGMK